MATPCRRNLATFNKYICAEKSSPGNQRRRNGQSWLPLSSIVHISQSSNERKSAAICGSEESAGKERAGDHLQRARCVFAGVKKVPSPCCAPTSDSAGAAPSSTENPAAAGACPAARADAEGGRDHSDFCSYPVGAGVRV
jgi:hypothetical protein